MSIQSEIERIEQNVANTYDALEEQGATMPTQKNSNNLAATARTVSAGSGGTTVQADLAVNDPSNPRYVKNRTHWKEVFDGPEGEVISETAVSFTSNIKTITGAMSDAIKVGGKYIVTWNGTDYECIGKASDDGNYIGNGSFMNVGSMTLEDTGEPFCVLLFGGTYYMVYKADKTAETITVKVVGVKETIWHKLDKGYLDEALQFGSEMVEILPETTVEIDPDNGGELAATALLVEGQSYKVKYNGAEYDCTCTMVTFDDDSDGVPEDFYFLGNAGALLGTGDTGEPFIILSIPAFGVFAINSLDGSTSATVSITGEVVKKLDGKFLPNGVPYKEMGLVEILPEMTVEGGEEVPIMTEIELVEGNTYTVKWNGVEYTCVAHKWEMDGFTAGIVVGDYGLITMGAPVTGDPFIIADLSAEFAAEAGGVPTMLMCIDGSTSVTLSITNKAEVAHKIAGELLPEGVPYVEPFDDVIMAAWPSSITPEGTFTDHVGALAVGNIYKVNWGGTIYECTAQEAPGYGAALGNLSILGGKASSDPFGIVLTSPSAQVETGFTGIILCDDPPENYEFSIVGGWKVRQIDKRCLPDSTEPLVVKVKSEGDGVYASDITYAEVEAALCGDTPRMVYLLVVHNTLGYLVNGGSCYTFSNLNGGSFYFQSIGGFSQSGTPILKVSVIEWKDDNTISLYKNAQLTT